MNIVVPFIMEEIHQEPQVSPRGLLLHTISQRDSQEKLSMEAVDEVREEERTHDR